MSPSEQVPPAWVMTLIDGIRREMSEQHKQLRDEMAAGFAALRSEMQVQNGRVRTSEERLVRIETAREFEEKASLRRGSLAGALAAVIVAFILQVIKAWIEK